MGAPRVPKHQAAKRQAAKRQAVDLHIEDQDQLGNALVSHTRQKVDDVRARSCGFRYDRPGSYTFVISIDTMLFTWRGKVTEYSPLILVSPGVYFFKRDHIHKGKASPVWYYIDTVQRIEFSHYLEATQRVRTS